MSEGIKHGTDGSKALGDLRGASLTTQLHLARRDFQSLLRIGTPSSAILHPLYASNSKHHFPTRSLFQRHIQTIRSTLVRLRDETNASTSQVPDEGNANANAESIRERKQKILSLLKEASSHSTAISDGSTQLQAVEDHEETYLPESLSACALAQSKQQSWPTSDLKVAIGAVLRFVKAGETMAKELAMEAFAEEFAPSMGKGSEHTHTLTLAAGILVIDLEAGLKKVEGDLWKPLVRLRISYATDSSATSTPRKHDLGLAECLAKDFQTTMELLLGWGNDSHLASSASPDALVKTAVYFARLKRKLRYLKKLDDLSTRLNKNTGKYPDLFAAMDDFSEKIHSAGSRDGTAAHQIQTGLGLPLRHVSWPYITIFYYLNPLLLNGMALDTMEDIQNLVWKPDRSQKDLHTIYVGVESFSLKLEDNHLPLPGQDGEDSSRAGQLFFTAFLDRPVPMKKSAARKLALAAGLSLEHRPDRTKTVRETLANSGKSMQNSLGCSLQDLLTIRTSFPHVDDTEEGSLDMRFAPAVVRTGRASDQGVLVSRFPFASVEHLRSAVCLLRQQVQLNDLLCEVKPDEGSVARNDAPTLESFMANALPPSTSLKSTIALREAIDGSNVISVFVPLSFDTWVLEVEIRWIEPDWCVKALISRLGMGKEAATHSPEESIYQQCTSTLRERGGRGLKSMLERLQQWAIRTVRLITAKQETGKGAEPVAALLQSEPLAMVEKQTEADDNMEEVCGDPSTSVLQPQPSSLRSSTRRASKAELSPSRDVTGRHRSSAQSRGDDGEAQRPPSAKRRASQAGVDEDHSDNGHRRSRQRS